MGVNETERLHQDCHEDDLREPNLVTSKNICRAAPSVSNGVVTLLLNALVTRGF